MAIDLEKLSQAELDALIANAERQKKKIHRTKINDVRRQLTTAAKDAGYTIDELFGTGSRKASSRTGTKVPPKYRNPANPDQTWTGRGKRPRWFNEALAKGRKEGDMRI
ncbi:MAG: H-NS histone family protein [Xanthomonadaceae bacterium]|jgi:DNA-binding protein H-NS|nr:H-NS histone family protein [Xanthomonadaceae bacterium]